VKAVIIAQNTLDVRRDFGDRFFGFVCARRRNLRQAPKAEIAQITLKIRWDFGDRIVGFTPKL
jgi:hypothetical protein